MIRYFISFCIIFFSLSVIAQNQKIKVLGEVTDIRTKEPLMGVQVIFDKTYGTITDKDGIFEFSHDTGEVVITVKLLGYKTIQKLVEVKDYIFIVLQFELEPTLNQLDEVVVSADKLEKRISELSVSMDIIKPFEITRKHIINVEEIINQTQGIEVMDGQASIRGGSGFSYGAGSRVLALIDGLPALSTDAGNIRWQFLPIENLSQIEVIKGASSVLYGSSALNGVINLRTADADTIPQIRFSLLSGIYDKPSQKNWVWSNSPQMNYDASFSYSKKYNNTELCIGSNFLIDNGYRKLNDEKIGRINFRVKQHSAKHDGLNFGAGFIAGYNVKQDFILWENADSGALIQNQSTAIELNALYFTFDPFISFRPDERKKHDLRLRLQYTDNKYPDNSVNNSAAISNYLEYQYIRKIFEKLNTISGITHTYSKISSDFYGNHHGNNISAFTQVEYNPFLRFKISSGFRLELNELDGKTDELIPIFRAGLNFQAASNTFVRASFGQGYRFPSIAEKYAYTSLGPVKIYPNPEIRSEYGWSSEIGLKQGLKLGKFLGQADLAFFLSKNKDMIEYLFGLFADPVTAEIDFGFRSSNIENSMVYGAETEIILNRYFGKFFTSFGAGYTYLHPVELDKVNNQSTEIYLKYRRKHSAKFFVNTSFKKIELGFNAYIKSKILNIDDVFLNPLTRESLLPGFYDYWLNNNKTSFIVDGFFAYWINKIIKLSFGIKNIGNFEYMGRPGDIQAQRYYSLQLNLRI